MNVFHLSNVLKENADRHVAIVMIARKHRFVSRVCAYLKCAVEATRSAALVRSVEPIATAKLTVKILVKDRYYVVVTPSVMLLTTVRQFVDVKKDSLVIHRTTKSDVYELSVAVTKIALMTRAVITIGARLLAWFKKTFAATIHYVFLKNIHQFANVNQVSLEMPIADVHPLTSVDRPHVQLVPSVKTHVDLTSAFVLPVQLVNPTKKVVKHHLNAVLIRIARHRPYAERNAVVPNAKTHVLM